jgi:hypothetical protein
MLLVWTNDKPGGARQGKTAASERLCRKRFGMAVLRAPGHLSSTALVVPEGPVRLYKCVDSIVRGTRR